MSLFLYFIQITGIMLGFFAFYVLALQKETTFRINRAYLLSTIAISILLPLIKIYVDFQTVPVPEEVFVGSLMGSFENTVVISPQRQGLNFDQHFLMIYLTGVCWFSIRLIVEVIRLMQLKTGGMVSTIAGHTCVLSPKIKTPFSFFNTIYLPVDHGFSHEELQEVIQHEHSHIAGKHSLDILVMELFCIALWISPVIYLYRRKLREVHEYLADAAVIRNTPWEQYAQLLVSCNYNGLQSRLSNQLIYSQLKNRLVMMTQKPSSFIAKLKYSGVLPILSIAIILFSIREKVSLQENIQSPANANQLEKVVVTAMAPEIVSQDQNVNSGFYHYTSKENATLQVSAKGRLLKEGKDYTVNQANGTLRIINPDYLGPDIPIMISFKEEGKIDKPITVEGNTEQPIFPGCEKENLMVIQECSQKKLMEYVAQHLKYPQELIDSKIEGKVFVKFVVGLNGLLSVPVIQKSLHPAADQAALDVVSSMNKEVGKWTPGSKEGIPVSMEMILPISFALTPQMKGEPYTYVEYMPEFPGGTSKLYEFIADKIKYPKEDRAKGLEGTVMAQLVVEPDGRVSNIKVLRGVSPAMDEEVIRVINLMNGMEEKWRPGIHEGKPVAVLYTLPVKFQLQAKAKE